MSIDRWMDKEDGLCVCVCIHTYIHIYVCMYIERWWWTGKPGMLQSMRSQRVGYNWATELNTHTHTHTHTHTRTYNGILLNHKIEWNNAICSNMDRHRDYTKGCKSERERQSYDLYVESKIWHKWTYLRNRNRLTDIEQTCGCQGECGVSELSIESLGLAHGNCLYRMSEQQGPTV